LNSIATNNFITKKDFCDTFFEFLFYSHPLCFYKSITEPKRYIEQVAEALTHKLEDYELEWYNKHHVKRPLTKIDDIIAFQTGIFTDIFKLLASNINKKIANKEILTLIHECISLESHVLEEKGKKQPEERRVSTDESIIVEDNVTFDTKNIISEKIKPVWMDDAIWQEVSGGSTNKRARSFFSNKVHKIINKQIGNIWEV